MPVLEFQSARDFAWSDIYSDYSIGMVVSFRLVAPATSEQYLFEMLEAVPGLQMNYLGHTDDTNGIIASHGPYRPDVLTVENYRACTVEEAEGKFRSWIGDFSGDSVDAEPILSREVRPLLAQAELFIQVGAYEEWAEPNADRKVDHKERMQVEDDQHPQLCFNALILDGWIEVVAIDRTCETFTMIIALAD